MNKREFLTDAMRIYNAMPNNCHSFYLGILLSGQADYENEVFASKNEELERRTAELLNVKHYSDGCSIVLSYAYHTSEDELESLSDEEYERKIDKLREKYTKKGWRTMFGLVYEIFLRDEIKQAKVA